MRADKALAGAYAARLQSVLRLVQGNDDVERLLHRWEERFAEYIGTRFSLALNSGSDALQIALMASGVKAGDEVIVPDLTYPIVGLVVRYLKAVPILVDVSPEDLNIDSTRLEKAITRKTKAIIAVHMFSQACRIEKIMAIAKKHGLIVIEDVCQAESSTFKGKRLGSWADIGCFSFSYYKPLSSCGGGGGMMTFNDPRFKECLRYTQVWRDEPALAQMYHRFPRMYLLDLIAIETKFTYITKIIQSRMKIQKCYEEGLRGIPGLSSLTMKPHCSSVLQNYTIMADDRDGLDTFLQQHEIFAMRPYTPLHALKAFSDCVGKNTFQVSQRYWKQALHLPLFSFMTEEECLFVCDRIRKFFGKKKPRRHLR